MSDKNKNSSEETKTADTKEKKPKKKANLKKFKFGSVSMVVMILVIAITVVINLMVGAVSERYPLKLDLTPDKRYEITDESIEVLKNLDRNVEITVTTTKDTFTQMANYFKQMYRSYYGMNIDMPYDMIPEVLEKYAVNSNGKIEVKYVDINKDPDIITRYNQYYSGEIGEGSIVIYSNERIKVISNDDVINMISPSQASTQNAITMNFAGESTITSAIMSVVDSNPVTVAVASAMNGASLFESAYSSVAASVEDFLSKNGYDCSEIDIASDSLNPDDYEMIVLPMPSMDLSADIIDKLGDFLYNGGKYERNLLYIPNLYAVNLPNIEEFLADWSIKVESSVILDDNMIQAPIQALGVMDAAAVMNVADSDSVGTLPNDALPIAAPYTRAITVLTKNNESKVTEILKSSETSYLRDLTAEAETNPEHGVYNAAVISQKATAEGFETYKSNILVIGSSFMADSAILTANNTYNNASVILGMVNNMTGKEGGVVIADKALQQASIAPTSGEMAAIRIIVIIVIPLIVVFAGAFVLLRRKNK